VRGGDELRTYKICKPRYKLTINAEGKDRGRSRKIYQGRIVAPRKPRKGWRGRQRVWGEAQIAAVNEAKRVKKPGAGRQERRLGSEVSTLVVDSLLLHGPCWTHSRVGCGHFHLVYRG